MLPDMTFNLFFKVKLCNKYSWSYLFICSCRFLYCSSCHNFLVVLIQTIKYPYFYNANLDQKQTEAVQTKAAAYLPYIMGQRHMNSLNDIYGVRELKI